jgi:hypothetical protein
MLTIATLAAVARAQQPETAKSPTHAPRNYVGFDANEYPGDELIPILRKQFSFAGYWLTNPPGANHNPWVGKRDILRRNGFGFLVLANGRLDKEILASQKSGKFAAALGSEDAATAATSAQREGFPPHTILFLDQEEGGRMLPEQAAYLLAWTEAIAHTDYRPGVYASGQPVPDGNGPDGKPVTITTIQDLRQRVAAGHLQEIAFWAAQDACPPAPGCVIPPNLPAPDDSATLALTALRHAEPPTIATATAMLQARLATNSTSTSRALPTPPTAADLRSSGRVSANGPGWTLRLWSLAPAHFKPAYRVLKSKCQVEELHASVR